jgi:hypothetical protein
VSGTHLGPVTNFSFFCNLLLLLVLACAVPLGSEYFIVPILFDSPNLVKVKVKVKAALWLTASQSICLGVKPNLGLLTRVFFSSFSKLRSCLCGAPSLTRGRVCHLSVLVNKVYSSQSVKGQVPVFISPRNRVAQLYPPVQLNCLSSPYITLAWATQKTLLQQVLHYRKMCLPSCYHTMNNTFFIASLGS